MMTDMGPYAIFIWGSYGVSAVVIGALVIRAFRSPKP